MIIRLYNLIRLFMLVLFVSISANSLLAQCAYTFGNSLQFNGSGHSGPAVVCGNGSSTNLTGTLTLEAWVNFSGLNSSCNVIMARTTAGTSDGGYALFLNTWGTSDAKIVFETTGGALTSNVAVPLNEWHHIAVAVGSATSATIYLDGVAQASTGSVNLQANATESFSIGAMASGAYYKFNGKIDDVRVWNYTRNTAQVQADMYNTRLGAWVGMVASYDFNVGTPDGSNTGLTELRDTSGYGNHGTLTGFTLAGTTANWTYGNLNIIGNSSICGAGTLQLTHNISGGTWSSSSTAVATVSSTGLVTGVGNGTATITYTYSWYGCTTKQTTKVISVGSTPVISGNSVVSVGSQLTLTSSISGGTWTSSNTAIATVNSSGVVTGISSGTASITCTLPTGCATTQKIGVGNNYVANFDDMYAISANNTNNYYTCSKGLSITNGFVVGGNGNGDPGNWDIAGSNGSAFLGINSAVDITLTASSAFNYIAFDIGASMNSNYTYTITSYNSDNSVNSTQTVSFYGANNNQNGTFVTVFVNNTSPVKSVKISKTAGGFAWGVDNIQMVASAGVVSVSSVTGNTNICSGLTTSLTATSTAASPTFNWYNDSTTSTVLYTGATFTTPALTASRKYFVTVTSSSCTSERASVSIIVNPSPTVTATTPANRCGAGTVTLKATASAGAINWYAGSTGGTSLATDTSFTTPSISTTTTYYVTATNNGCTTASRTAVIATVNTIPTPTITVNGDTTLCAKDSTILTSLNNLSTTSGAIQFNGTNSYVQEDSTLSLNVNQGFTIEGWMKINNLNKFNALATQTVGNNPAPFDIYTANDGSGKISFLVGTGGVTGAITSTTGITANTWSHVACVYNNAAGQIYIYINGVLSATGTATLPSNNASSVFRIGNRHDNYTFTSGMLDEIRIWNSVRTQAQILANMNVGVPNNSATLKAYYQFNEGTGTQTANSVTGLSSAKLINSPTWITSGAAPSYGPYASYLWSNGSTASSIVVRTTGNYSVTVTDNNGCTGSTASSRSITADTAIIGNSISGTQSICSGSTPTTLNGSTPTGGNRTSYTYAWLKSTTSAIAGFVAATGTANTINYSPAALTQTTWYKRVVTSGLCGADTSAAIQISVNTIPTVTATTPATRCGTGTVTLGATASAGTIKWYAAATGGSALDSATTFTTPSISATTTYYVDATNSGCTTATRTAVAATVNAIPTVATTTPATRCGTGTVTLGATASAGTIKWYAAATGGTALDSATTFTTPSLSTTTTYYVDATNTGCTTATRTAVAATVNAIPTVATITPATRCGTGTLTLGATASAGTIKWYAAATGGSALDSATTFTTPSLSTSTTYYVDATNTGCTTATRTAVAATVNAIPTVATTTPATRCGTGTVTLGATASAGTIKWYAAATSGSALDSATTFTTPSLSTSTTYYVDATNTGCTTATRTAVIATVNTIPTVTATTPANRCGTGTVTLKAAASAGTINWYAAATGGTSLATDTSFTTPSISTTTTYYVDATNTGCTTATRTAVIATVNTIPTVATTTPVAICGTGTVTLGATASAGTLNWYAAATGGTSLATGTSYTTPSISATTTYYVDATNNGCTTATRTAVIATVNAIPTVTATTPAAICGTGTATLGATASAGTLNWYAAATGGTSLATGTSFTTPSISATTTYYVDATNNGCTTTTRTAIAATVNAIPTVATTTPASRCGTGTVTLGATASAGTVKWYAAAAGGSALDSATTFTTPSLSTTTTYYVDATSNGCTTATRTAIAATVNAIPTVATTTPATRCGTGTVALGATASAGMVKWYAAATGGSALDSANTYTTPSISATTTYYVDATNNGCTTATRTAVIATVNPNLTASVSVSASSTSICGSTPITFTATPTNGGTTPAYQWKKNGVNVGTSSDTYVLNGAVNGDSVYVVLTSNATPCLVNVTSNSNGIKLTSSTVTPSVAVVASPGTTICAGTSVTFTATATNGGTTPAYQWMKNGVNVGTNSNVFTTSSLLTNDTIKVVLTSNASCVSTTTATSNNSVVTVNAIPTVTATTPAAICGTGTATLGATASAGTLNWYAAATGGTSLATGTSFTTPSISATTTYYVDATNNGCTTATRTAVIATVNTIPTVTATTPATICGTGTVTLGATASAGTLNWYAAATGGASLATGTSFTTPSISATTTYYVDATNNGCTTATRSSVIATVNTTPTVTAITPAAICGTGTATLGATASAGTLNWYAAATGGTSLATGTSYTTPSISATTTYYVDATNNGCTTAARTAIAATVNAVPTVATTTPATICGTGTATLGATASAGTLNWYAATTGGTSLSTGTSFTTPSISATTTYYVDATNNGCTTATRSAIAATVNAVPTVATTTPATRCGTGTVTLGSTASAGTINWYAAATGGTSLATGTSFTTPSISVTTTYYVDATNNGCTTATRSAVIATVNAKPVTSTISGRTSVHKDTLETYSVINTVGSVYNWTIIGGIKLSGGTTNSIVVRWDSSYTSGTVKVVETSLLGCAGDTVVKNIVSIVPVELMSFNAKRVKTKAELTWITASELNNRGFEVERSIDNKNFEYLGSVKGHGTTLLVNNYNYNDDITALLNTGLTQVYYRLKQVDYNGKFAYSPVRVINLNNEFAFDIQAVPNPSNGKFTVRFNSMENKDGVLKIYDNKGALIWSNSVKLGKGINEHFIDLDLSQGIYNVLFDSGDDSQTIRVVIK